MEIEQRFEAVALLAEEYASFVCFAYDGMEFLGFTLTEQQADIAYFMEKGERLRMVMAQRGEAKTTLAALYAIWRIIQRPSTRVLIVSAGEQNSSDTATLIVRIIMTWELIECLRPDRNAGDRVSTAAFDIHYALKGLDRSPSIACAGITSNLPGRRADLLIPDDIESNKNGLTVVQRQQLLQASKEFSSICTHGDILYLGTPQSKDSIYNTLPSRGFELRIWPGRYPTNDELENYGDRLAPSIAERLRLNPALQRGGGLDGTRGKPTDTGRYTEQDLIEKELDKGPEDFQLQYMLDTSLSDAQRLQLKLQDFVVANYDHDLLPEISVYRADPRNQVQLPLDFPVQQVKMYHPVAVDCTFRSPEFIYMFIDPAGGGQDELAYAIGCSLGPYVHVLDCGGLKGGLTESNGKLLSEIIAEFKVAHIDCESNMGAGMFETNLRAVLAGNGLSHVAVAGQWSSGQKEKRIIDSMVSSLQRHRIILHKRVFESDTRWNKQHAQANRTQYSVFYQIANITTDRDSLTHDDRIEAMAGVVRKFKAALMDDEHAAAEARAKEEVQKMLANPMGYTHGDWDSRHRPAVGIRATLHRRHKRR